MTQQDLERLAFLTGYDHGHIAGTHASPREATERFPAWNAGQIDAYLNGRDDGVRGDPWRASQLRRSAP